MIFLSFKDLDPEIPEHDHLPLGCGSANGQGYKSGWGDGPGWANGSGYSYSYVLGNGAGDGACAESIKFGGEAKGFGYTTGKNYLDLAFDPALLGQR